LQHRRKLPITNRNLMNISSKAAVDQHFGDDAMLLSELRWSGGNVDGRFYSTWIFTAT
jgi:hypothetical protein